uniref:Uncharacterized protein n=1 Tax=Ditylenchus dipsaci TaxID=166011 RepID=A0A915EA76_9BILA
MITMTMPRLAQYKTSHLALWTILNPSLDPASGSLSFVEFRPAIRPSTIHHLQAYATYLDMHYAKTTIFLYDCSMTPTSTGILQRRINKLKSLCSREQGNVTWTRLKAALYDFDMH